MCLDVSGFVSASVFTFCFLVRQLCVCGAGCLTQHPGDHQAGTVSAGLVAHYCQEKSKSGKLLSY